MEHCFFPNNLELLLFNIVIPVRVKSRIELFREHSREKLEKTSKIAKDTGVTNQNTQQGAPALGPAIIATLGAAVIRVLSTMIQTSMHIIHYLTSGY